MRNVFKKTLLATAVAGTLIGGGMSTASADVSASVTAASMYLWRGINLTPDGAAVSGSLDYSHENGFYAGIWTSTETEGHETDLYAGFAGEVGGFGYDIAYFYYMYPEENGPDEDIDKSALSDVYVGLSYGPVFANFYQQVDNDPYDDSLDLYYTVGGSYNQFTFFYGGWEPEEDYGTDYSHVQLDFAATDSLSFSVSKAVDDNDQIEKDPLFMVAYSLSFDL